MQGNKATKMRWVLECKRKIPLSRENNKNKQNNVKKKTINNGLWKLKIKAEREARILKRVPQTGRAIEETSSTELTVTLVILTKRDETMPPFKYFA